MIVLDLELQFNLDGTQTLQQVMRFKSIKLMVMELSQVLEVTKVSNRKTLEKMFMKHMSTMTLVRESYTIQMVIKITLNFTIQVETLSLTEWYT